MRRATAAAPLDSASSVSVAAAAAAAAVLLFAAPSAGAGDFNVSSDTLYQQYAVRTLYAADPLEYKTRVTELLRFTYATPAPLGEKGMLRVHAALRYDVDFGLEDECGVGGVLGPTPFHTNTVDEMAARPGNPAGAPLAPHLRLVCGSALDVTLLYVSGERLLGGLLDVRLGRQWKTDPLGWLAFDGGLVTVRFPWFFSVSVAAGLETTSGLLLAKNAWERDGTNVRVDGPPTAGRAGLTSLSGDWSLHASPFVSAGLAARGYGRNHAEIVYRRVFGSGIRAVRGVDSTLGTVGIDGGSRVGSAEDALFPRGVVTEEERIGWALGYGLSDAIRVRASVVADLLWPRFDEITLEGSGRLVAGALGLRAGAQFLRPRFSASSVFYFYDFRPTADLYVRADYRLGETAWVWLRGGLRRFGDSWRIGGDRDVPSEATGIELGPAFDAGAHLALGDVSVDVSGSGSFGFAGTDTGAMASAAWTVLPRRLDLLASGYLYYYDNVLQRDPDGQPLQAGLFGGASAGVEYTFGEGARLRLVAEEHVSPFFRSNARVYALLSLGFWL